MGGKFQNTKNFEAFFLNAQLVEKLTRNVFDGHKKKLDPENSLKSFSVEQRIITFIHKINLMP